MDRKLDKLLSLLVLILLSACAVIGTSETRATPTVSQALVSPSATDTQIIEHASPTPTHTYEPTSMSGPATTSTPSPTISSPTLPILAWTITSDDGVVFVIDATYSLYQLSTTDLTPLTKSAPLFETASKVQSTEGTDKPKIYLLADSSYIFIGNRSLAQTLILNRNDLSQVAILDRSGRMALDSGKRLFMIWNGVIAYDVTDFSQPPQEVVPRPEGSTFPRHLMADSTGRRLYVTHAGSCGSRSCGGYSIYDLDTFEYLSELNQGFGSRGSPLSVSEKTGRIVVSTDTESTTNLAEALLIYDRQGQELASYYPFKGQPIIDAAGDWIYFLLERELWILRGDDFTLQAILPFPGVAPVDFRPIDFLKTSPDGKLLYLFTNGTLSVFKTEELRAQRIAPVSPFPKSWLFGARVYPSPGMDRDNTAFIMLPYSRLYRTPDQGQTWFPVPTLLYPNFKYVSMLSISPDFANDRTLVVPETNGDSIFRSTDGGDTWDEWIPPLAFVSDRDNNREIYLMNQEGGDLQRVTHNLAADENPAWSPAWTRLAFQSNRYGNWDIFTMRLDCDLAHTDVEALCDVQQLTNSPTDDMLPAWSPDGRSIAFVSTRDGNPEIYVMDADGQNQRRLTFHPGGDWRPAWLSNSRQLVFTSDRAGNNDIYKLTVPLPISTTLNSELELIQLTTDPADDRDPAIRYDETTQDKLIFLSDRNGFTNVYEKRSTYETNAVSFVGHSFKQPVGHPAWTNDEYDEILVSMEQDGITNIYHRGYNKFTPVIESLAFDGQPAWGAVFWVPDEVETSQELDTLLGQP